MRPLFRLALATFTTALACFAAGCDNGDATDGDSNPEPSTEGTIPEQLELLELSLTGLAQQQSSVAGALTVSGSAREFTITVAGEDAAAVELELHSPGASPLASLDGIDAAVRLTDEGMGGRSVIISDEAGIVYFGGVGDFGSTEAANEHFGSGFVTYGEKTGSQTDGMFVWTYAPAVFATDDGPVELLPGEVETIVVEGVKYRAVVSSSYEVGTNPDAEELPGCSPESMLGFELLRVDAAVDTSVVERLADHDVAYVGCTAPGGGE